MQSAIELNMEEKRLVYKYGNVWGRSKPRCGGVEEHARDGVSIRRSWKHPPERTANKQGRSGNAQTVIMENGEMVVDVMRKY